MNNYPNFKNFNYTDMYNMNNSFNNDYENVLYNMFNSTNNSPKSSNSLYDPYNGFIRGNLFKDLYDPYKQEEPYEIKPMNEQAKILTNIDALGFAMTDLNLYLDVNPNNKEAINLFNEYKLEKKKLVKDYESRFGPLTIESDSLNTFPWSWNNMPWPWDN